MAIKDKDFTTKNTQFMFVYVIWQKEGMFFPLLFWMIFFKADK